MDCSSVHYNYYYDNNIIVGGAFTTEKGTICRSGELGLDITEISGSQ
jgi:hypothetical protein